MCNEDYCSFEQSVKLKELGFDWECHYHYEINRLLSPNVRTFYYSMDIDSDDLCFDVNGRNIGDISAPTLSQAAKWLREVKGISVESVSCGYEDNVNGNIIWSSFICLLKDKLGFDQAATFNSYEQALSAGIDKALELLK